MKTVDEFVNEVVEGENGSGSVYLDGYTTGIGWTGGVYIGVATDSPEADYRLEMAPTDLLLAEIEAKLTAGGLDVYRDAGEWQKLLEEYEEYFDE